MEIYHYTPYTGYVHGMVLRTWRYLVCDRLSSNTDNMIALRKMRRKGYVDLTVNDKYEYFYREK
jgi:hypothetical protein